MAMSSVGKSGPEEHAARHISLTVFPPPDEGQQ
jgi:hypothetical protein